jgi:hypothetical protein
VAQEKLTEEQKQNIDNYNNSLDKSSKHMEVIEKSKKDLSKVEEFQSKSINLDKRIDDLRKKGKHLEADELKLQKERLEKEKDSLGLKEGERLGKKITDLKEGIKNKEEQYNSYIKESDKLYNKTIESLPEHDRKAIEDSNLALEKKRTGLSEELEPKNNELSNLNGQVENVNKELDKIQKQKNKPGITDTEKSKLEKDYLAKEADLKEIKNKRDNLQKDISAKEHEYKELRRTNEELKQKYGIGPKEPPEKYIDEIKEKYKKEHNGQEPSQEFLEEAKKKYNLARDIYAGDLYSKDSPAEREINGLEAKKKIASEFKTEQLEKLKESGNNIQSSRPAEAVKEVENKAVTPSLTELRTTYTERYNTAAAKREELGNIESQLSLLRSGDIAEYNRQTGQNIRQEDVNKRLQELEGKKQTVTDAYNSALKETTDIRNKMIDLLPESQRKELVQREERLNGLSKELESVYKEKESVYQNYERDMQEKRTRRSQLQIRLNSLNPNSEEYRIVRQELDSTEREISACQEGHRAFENRLRAREQEYIQERRGLDRTTRETGLMPNDEPPKDLSTADSLKYRAVDDMLVGRIPRGQNPVEDAIINTNTRRGLALNSKYSLTELEDARDIGTTIVMGDIRGLGGTEEGADGYTQRTRIFLSDKPKAGILDHEMGHIVENYQIADMGSRVSELYKERCNDPEFKRKHKNSREFFTESLREYRNAKINPESMREFEKRDPELFALLKELDSKNQLNEEVGLRAYEAEKELDSMDGFFSRWGRRAVGWVRGKSSEEIDREDEEKRQQLRRIMEQRHRRSRIDLPTGASLMARWDAKPGESTAMSTGTEKDYHVSLVNTAPASPGGFTPGAGWGTVTGKPPGHTGNISAASGQKPGIIGYQPYSQTNTGISSTNPISHQPFVPSEQRENTENKTFYTREQNTNTEKEKPLRETKSEDKSSAKEENNSGITKEEESAGITKEEKTAGMTIEEKTAGLTLEEKTAGMNLEEKKSGMTKEEKTAGMKLEEKKTGMTLEEKKAEMTKEEKTAGMNLEEKTSGMTKEEKTAGITKEEKTAGINREEKTAGITKEEKTAGITKEEKTAGITREEKTSGITREEKTSGITREEKTAGITKEEKTAGITKEEKTAGITKEEKTAGITKEEKNFDKTKDTMAAKTESGSKKTTGEADIRTSQQKTQEQQKAGQKESTNTQLNQQTTKEQKDTRQQFQSAQQWVESNQKMQTINQKVETQGHSLKQQISGEANTGQVNTQTGQQSLRSAQLQVQTGQQTIQSPQIQGQQIQTGQQAVQSPQVQGQQIQTAQVQSQQVQTGQQTVQSPQVQGQQIQTAQVQSQQVQTDQQTLQSPQVQGRQIQTAQQTIQTAQVQTDQQQTHQTRAGQQTIQTQQQVQTSQQTVQDIKISIQVNGQQAHTDQLKTSQETIQTKGQINQSSQEQISTKTLEIKPERTEQIQSDKKKTIKTEEVSNKKISAWTKTGESPKKPSLMQSSRENSVTYKDYEARKKEILAKEDGKGHTSKIFDTLKKQNVSDKQTFISNRENKTEKSFKTITGQLDTLPKIDIKTLKETSEWKSLKTFDSLQSKPIAELPGVAKQSNTVKEFEVLKGQPVASMSDAVKTLMPEAVTGRIYESLKNKPVASRELMEIKMAANTRAVLNSLDDKPLVQKNVLEAVRERTAASVSSIQLLRGNNTQVNNLQQLQARVDKINITDNLSVYDKSIFVTKDDIKERKKQNINGDIEFEQMMAWDKTKYVTTVPTEIHNDSKLELMRLCQMCETKVGVDIVLCPCCALLRKKMYTDLKLVYKNNVQKNYFITKTSGKTNDQIELSLQAADLFTRGGTGEIATFRRGQIFPKMKDMIALTKGNSIYTNKQLAG